MICDDKIYNKHFSTTTNEAIKELVHSSSFNNAPPRINRKNGASRLDEYYPIILEKIAEKKTQGQILKLLETKFKLEISKSALCRFVNKKFKA